MTDWRLLIAASMNQTVAELQRLCRQPSISSSGHGIREMADLVTDLISGQDGRVQLLSGDGGNPVVSAEFAPHGRASDRTLLYYNHYDVQPPEPLEDWNLDPFSAEIRDGRFFARGAADNKGDLIARLTAIRILQANGGLPCRVRFMIEGEEEVGSPSLAAVLEEHADRFQADACVWEFGDVDAAGRPQLYGGVKGMAYLELTSRTASSDIHSAMGALIESPGWRLVQALATLKDQYGRIMVDGFYDQVHPPTQAMRRLASQIPFDPEGLRVRFGLTRPLLTENGDREPIQAFCFEPTCTICGLESGYAGDGSKTVLPRSARAKLDFRLVPGQDPEEIYRKVRRHLNRRGFEEIGLELLNGCRAHITDPGDRFVRLVQETAATAWGAPPVYHPCSAGTGPMELIHRSLRLPIVSTGCGWYGSRVHASDESIRLQDLERGIHHQILLLKRFAEVH